MKKTVLVITAIASLGLSGCVAALAAGAGAGTVACTEKELDCPFD